MMKINPRNNYNSENLKFFEISHYMLLKFLMEKQVQKMDQVLAIPKEYIRQTAFQYFDLKAGVDSYLQVYKRILKD